MSIYCALVHHPVRDRHGAVVTTSVTNLDVHDLARASRTYGLAGFAVVTPIAAQRRLVDGIVEHWTTGPGRQRVPERTEALSLCWPTASIEEAGAEIERREGQPPQRVVTAAKAPAGREVLSFAQGRARIVGAQVPSLILFGTGHGLAWSVMEEADLVLAPIRPHADYNHLSVRTAAAIVFDRLIGD